MRTLMYVCVCVCVCMCIVFVKLPIRAERSTVVSPFLYISFLPGYDCVLFPEGGFLSFQRAGMWVRSGWVFVFNIVLPGLSPVISDVHIFSDSSIKTHLKLTTFILLQKGLPELADQCYWSENIFKRKKLPEKRRT